MRGTSEFKLTSVGFRTIADISDVAKLRGMNAALKATAQAVPKVIIYRVTGGVALGAAIASFAFASLLRPYLGSVVLYGAVPLLAAFAVFLIVAVVRLRLVGLLPSEAEHLIPSVLRPWIVFWLLSRLGLLGSMALLLATLIATALAGGQVQYAVNALICIILLRMFMDCVFGVAFNVGVISSRPSAS